MNCDYCFINKRKYFDFQNKKFTCKNCIYLGGFITVKGDEDLMDIEEKYEFNIHWKEIFYFKFNIYRYQKEGDYYLGIDFIFNDLNQRLIKNLMIHEEFFNLKYPV